VLTTHNKALESQIAQQASFSFTPPDRLLSKPESNPHEHCNYVTLKDRVKDPIDLGDAPFKEGREINMVESKERNDGGKTVTFIENESSEIPTCFPPKLPDPGSFSIPCVMGKTEIKRALCDLGASVSLMPYCFFHMLNIGPLQPAPFSLQLADGYGMQPLGIRRCASQNRRYLGIGRLYHY